MISSSPFNQLLRKKAFLTVRIPQFICSLLGSGKLPLLPYRVYSTDRRDESRGIEREQCACQGPHHCSWSIQQEIFRSLVEKFTRPFTRRGWLCYSSDSQYIDVICHKTPYKTCQLSGNRHFCNVALFPTQNQMLKPSAQSLISLVCIRNHFSAVPRLPFLQRC